jgi:hypothetical protein
MMTEDAVRFRVKYIRLDPMPEPWIILLFIALSSDIKQPVLIIMLRSLTQEGHNPVNSNPRQWKLR